MTKDREFLARRERDRAIAADDAAVATHADAVPGRATLVGSELAGVVQMRAVIAIARRAIEIRNAAARGVGDAGEPLPYLDRIQAAFGRYDVSNVRARIGGGAADACDEIGAAGYAFGDRVAFAAAPDLFTAAHEAAHVVQQRAGVDLDGGVGRTGDRYERDADEVAEAVVRGDSAEPLLARMVGQSPSTASRPVVQRWDREELRERQARQPWDTATLDGPLAATDRSVEDAIRANQALGFSRDQIGRLRVALGLRRGMPVIDRRFVQAVRRFQLDGEVVVRADQMDGTTEAGVRPADVGPSLDATGILDEATVIRLDLRGAIRSGARGSYASAPWTRFSAAEIDDIRLQLAERFALSSGDLVPRPRGGADASPHFIARAAGWQMWQYRGGTPAYGRLGLRELAALRVGVAYVPRPPRAAPDAAPIEPSTTTTGDEAAGEGSDDEAAATAERERNLAIVGERRAELQRLLGAYYATPRGSPERADAGTALLARMAAMRTEIEAFELPRTDFSGSSRFPRAHVQAQHMLDELTYIGDETRPPRGTPRDARIAAAEADSTLERRSDDDALAALRREGVIVDEHATRPVTHWDARVGDEGDPDRVAPRAARNVTALEDLQRRMVPHRDALRRVLRGPVARLDHREITRALDALAVEDFASQPGWRPIELSGDARASSSLDPRRRPTPLLTPGTAGALDDETRLDRARDWRGWLGEATGAIGTGGRGELRRQRLLATSHPSSVTPGRLVEVDLHRTGVTVTNNRGNPLPTSEMKLEPQFADAMLRFIREIQGLGVTELWTSAFLRNPTSTMDTHPRGQACDITGFLIGGELIHLRSGLPQDPPAAGDAAAMERYMAVRGGHSDWFDHTGRIGSHTHEEILHAITNLMRRYFSKIIGPGNDDRHMGHWHVELTDRGRDGPQVQAQMLDRDQRPDTAAAADRRHPGWRTPAERASFPDDE